MLKRRYMTITFLIFCLTVTAFWSITTAGNPSSTSLEEYDPWVDLNDDGIIDIFDLVMVASRFGTTGTPINKTALLELQSRIDSLNASLLDLEAYLKTSITTLNASLVELQSRVEALEIGAFIGAPAYDSGWFLISAGASVIFTHNLNTTNVLVYMMGKYSDTASPYMHQIFYGGDGNVGWIGGAYWKDLTTTTITVSRMADDNAWNYVRVMIWKIQS